jgi:hypothetical protein
MLLNTQHAIFSLQNRTQFLVQGTVLSFRLSDCNLISSTPSSVCRTQFLIQVTVLGLSYLFAIWRYENFYHVGHRHTHRQVQSQKILAPAPDFSELHQLQIWLWLELVPGNIRSGIKIKLELFYIGELLTRSGLTSK